MISRSKVIALLLSFLITTQAPAIEWKQNKAYYSLAALPTTLVLGGMFWAHMYFNKTYYEASEQTKKIVCDELATMGIKNSQNIQVRIKYEDHPKEMGFGEALGRTLGESINDSFDFVGNLSKQLLKGSRTIIFNHNINRTCSIRPRCNSQRRRVIKQKDKEPRVVTIKRKRKPSSLEEAAYRIKNHHLLKRIIAACAIPAISAFGFTKLADKLYSNTQQTPASMHILGAAVSSAFSIFAINRFDKYLDIVTEQDLEKQKQYNQS